MLQSGMQVPKFIQDRQTSLEDELENLRNSKFNGGA